MKKDKVVDALKTAANNSWRGHDSSAWNSVWDTINTMKALPEEDIHVPLIGLIVTLINRHDRWLMRLNEIENVVVKGGSG